MFQRYFDEGLAQSSYLLGCERTREAIVIDPRRDIDAYVAAARQHGLQLRYAIETHVHADFVSGARELALRFLHTPGHTPEHISIVANPPVSPRGRSRATRCSSVRSAAPICSVRGRLAASRGIPAAH